MVKYLLFLGFNQKLSKELKLNLMKLGNYISKLSIKKFMMKIFKILIRNF